MAQLPPKIPTIPQNWSPFAHQRVPSTMSNFMPSTSSTTSTSPTQQQQQQQQQQQLSSSSSWVDEFLDFSSARRGAHRRSASDSVAFLESPMMFFDRLDDDQLMSMFSDDVAAVALPNAPPSSASDPSSPSSDQTSNNDEKPMAMALDIAPTVQDQHHDLHVKPLKSEAVEDDGSCKNEAAAVPSSASTGGAETIVDPKRVKRILANRQSAQRSRVRKLQYISELERSVTSLQTEVSALSPRVAFLDHQRLILNVDNSALKQRIAALAQDKIFKDAHQEALKKEIERLRQIYHQQNLHKMGNSINNNNSNGHSLPSPRTPQAQPQPQMQPHSLHHHQLAAPQPSLACKDNEQLLS